MSIGLIEVGPDLLDDTSEHVAVVLARRVAKRLHLLETAPAARWDETA